MPVLPLGGSLNSLIIKFFCSTCRDQIKACIVFSLFELLVQKLYSYCINIVADFPTVQFLSKCLFVFPHTLNFLNDNSAFKLVQMD